jgi:hypothetical protein
MPGTRIPLPCTEGIVPCIVGERPGRAAMFRFQQTLSMSGVVLIAARGAVLAAPALFIFLLVPMAAVGQSRLPPCPNVSPETWNNCQGTRIISLGKYVGEFKNGQPNGQGTFVSPDGQDKYVGGFKDFHFHGKGTRTLAIGHTYVGQFKDGRMSGQGTYTYANGNKYVGEFKDDKANGQGTFVKPDGTKYVGRHEDGRLHGRGTKTYPNGDQYIGQFRDGKLGGQGTYAFANGGKYVGEFKDDKPDGRGNLFATDGSIISSGIWADGKFLGAAADLQFIRMEQSGGVYVVPVRFNDAITLDAVVDSGAADVSVPADLVLTLMRTKTITDADFLGEQTYVLADGSRVPSHQFRIRSLKVGTKTIENVVGSIASVNSTILLGQSFLSKFKSWSVDNEQHTLILR